ncbi:ABC transporter permease [Nonomuraea sp. NPDC050153]|uniref:ABC transporter permease n=1 Tax=Nonomuraea sp. NPDC050153 TaxID=3364359 RepID=UPI0037957191
MRIAHGWRIARISALYETLQPGRIAGVVAQTATQIFLTWCLWRALYQVMPVNAELSRGQAVTYALLGVLYTRLRGPDRMAARDQTVQHVRYGTILYWYLRPLSPRRYHRLRAIGDQVYGFASAAAAYLICLLLGMIEKPASPAAFGVFTISLVLGQVVLYHLLAIADVACFWTMSNTGIVSIIRFVQSVFAGAIAPLWFFPAWFQGLSAWLPFQSTFHIPVSIYVGRIPADSALHDVLVQILWVALLSLALRFLWSRADQRVVVQGG